VNEHPEYFVQGKGDDLVGAPDAFFVSGGKIIACGRDPFFPPWTDTAQLNAFHPGLREAAVETVLKIAGQCDGVRCDMAMLVLRDVFEKTWKERAGKRPEEDFWETTTEAVRARYPGFVFMAEAYWDLEWELQQAGFDFTYDKRLTDRLIVNDVLGVKSHLNAEISFQDRSARFLENHDEQRAIVSFGNQRSLAAAVLISSIPGMKFYFDGQFEGKKIRLPVQLGREPVEKTLPLTKEYYEKILSILKNKIFIDGKFTKLETFPSAEDNDSYEGMFAFMWELEKEMWIIVINYSEKAGQCRIVFDPETDRTKITLTDNMTGEKYIRKVEEIKNPGLYIELKSYRSHIFSIER
jgi:hypothetical protein